MVDFQDKSSQEDSLQSKTYFSLSLSLLVTFFRFVNTFIN
jgi:hypothetical protein